MLCPLGQNYNIRIGSSNALCENVKSIYILNCVFLFLMSTSIGVYVYVCVSMAPSTVRRGLEGAGGDGREVQPCGAAGRPDPQQDHIVILPHICS